MRYIKTDVTNHRELLELGYRESTHYCGLKKFQSVMTDINQTLEKYNVKLPFNPACFKHDVIYGEIFILSKYRLPEKILKKTRADFVFYRDMRKLIKRKDCTKLQKTVLKRIANLYFTLVTFGTLGYLAYRLCKWTLSLFKR